MRINKELIKAAAFNPTKKTYQITVSNLCEKIEVGEITLPLYQRDVSWTLQKSVDLLNYQLLGKAPVSPISINQINHLNDKTVVPQVSFIDRELIEITTPGQLSIADGQQRLTTNLKAYLNDSEFRNVVLDLIKGCFVIVQGNIKKYQIPVGILLNKEQTEFFNYLSDNSTLSKPEAMHLLMQIRNKIRDYNYTINLAEDLTEDEQIEWFEVLNNAGSRVTRIQMRFSKLKVNNIDIYTQYTKKFKEKVDSSGYELFKVKDTEVSIPVATLNSAFELVTEKTHTANYTPIPSDTRENKLCSLKPEQLLKTFELTLDALDRALEFIDKHELKTPDRLDYITYLTGAFVFINKRAINQVEEAEIISWYQNVVFKNKSNSERRALFSDLLSKLNIETGTDLSEE
ncbi:DUF262 domain-containing protein [Turicibacter sanguinis]|uniref:GmrSD restriction endonuclease domain-containing protein n=1 Tax=Turicibacter sanguinis TaxID=154288 RepID=UPI0029439D65|nr:DUF262 domain-containing protein [Turicibacter sanguinis]